MKPQNNLRVAIISTCITLLLTGCSRSPETTVEDFYRALADGEITEAKSYLSAQISGLIGDTKVTAALTNQYEKFQACGGIKDIVIDMQGKGELRSGTSTVTFNGDCRPKTEKTKLIEEDGTWKITASK